MGRWPSAGEPLKVGEPALGSGDLRPASRKRFALRGVERRHSLSRRDLWRDFESLEMRPKMPKKNSKAIAGLALIGSRSDRPLRVGPLDWRPSRRPRSWAPGGGLGAQGCGAGGCQWRPRRGAGSSAWTTWRARVACLGREGRGRVASNFSGSRARPRAGQAGGWRGPQVVVSFGIISRRGRSSGAHESGARSKGSKWAPGCGCS